MENGRKPNRLSVIDMALADAVARILQGNLSLDRDGVTASVCDGWVTLEGKVRWSFQREAAEVWLLDVPGVKGLTNAIHVVMPADPGIV